MDVCWLKVFEDDDDDETNNEKEWRRKRMVCKAQAKEASYIFG